MLNELLMIERGMRRAGIEMTPRHPELKDAARIPTLVVKLDERGRVAAVTPLRPMCDPGRCGAVSTRAFRS